jgi:predicted Zn-dependent protease
VATSDKALVGFRLEARVFARIPSEHIVRVLDAGMDEERRLAFIAMELLEGHTLGAMVRKEGRVPAEALVEVLAQTASALDAAHGATNPGGTPHPIIHRDLKPENIFVTRRSDGHPHAKLLDFGIAKIASPTAAPSVDARGTPPFMAREQLEGDVLSPQTDVAALGLIAFFCLTGRHYWKAANDKSASVSALMREMLGSTAVPASQRARELDITAVTVSPAFDQWFARCTAAKSDDRFATAGAAVHALALALNVRPKLSQPRPSSEGRVPQDQILAHAMTKLAIKRAPRPKSSAKTRRTVGIALATVIIALPIVAAVIWRQQLHPPAMAVSAPTVKPEALSASADGLAAFRDGDMYQSIRSLRRAVMIEPSFATAQTWLAAAASLGQRVKDLALAREAIQAASRYRDTLPPRERGLFLALERMLAVEPPDAGALVAGLQHTVDELPNDTALRTVYARALFAAGNQEQASAEAQRVIELDPDFGMAYVVGASAAEARDDVAERNRLLNACLTRLPGAVSCLIAKSYRTGARCEAVEASARQLIMTHPADPYGYRLLVRAFVNMARPRAEIAAVIEQATAHLTKDDRQRWEWRALATEAFEYGDFEEADKLAAQALEEHPADPEITPVAYWMRLTIAEETGDRAGAAAIAHAMLSRDRLWGAAWGTSHGELLTRALRAGAIDRVAFERERSAFRDGLSALYARLPDRPGVQLASFRRWVDGDVRLAASEDEAREAARVYQDRRLSFRPRSELEVVRAGEVWLRAGQYQQAISALETNLCDLNDGGPGFAIQRAALLGEARENSGDTSGACAAYASVLQRWGKAERSVSVAHIRRRMTGLGCAPVAR